MFWAVTHNSLVSKISGKGEGHGVHTIIFTLSVNCFDMRQSTHGEGVTLTNLPTLWYLFQGHYPV